MTTFLRHLVKWLRSLRAEWPAPPADLRVEDDSQPDRQPLDMQKPLLPEDRKALEGWIADSADTAAANAVEGREETRVPSRRERRARPT